MRLILLIFGIFLCSNLSVCAQESFPFLAQTVNERVNIRAGQSQNFEKLYQLNKGEEVVVIGKDFSWYKIQLPVGSYVYISDKYVRLLNDSQGEITADRVNVRALANTDASILGQVVKGDKISIAEKREGWYKIIPPKDKTFGWVAETLLTFKSKDIPVVPQPTTIVAEHAEQSKHLPIASVSRVSKEILKKEIVFASGILKISAHPQSANAPYELLTQDAQPAYFIHAPKDTLDNFARYKVSVEGTLNADPEKQFSRPVLDVIRIKLVL